MYKYYNLQIAEAKIIRFFLTKLFPLNSYLIYNICHMQLFYSILFVFIINNIYLSLDFNILKHGNKSLYYLHTEN